MASESVAVKVSDVQFIPGKDGFDPIVDVSEIPGGHHVVITDVEGPHEFDIMDGESAYQQAVEGGYTGTEQEFASDLASFKDILTAVLAAATEAGRQASNASSSEANAAFSANSAASYAFDANLSYVLARDNARNATSAKNAAVVARGKAEDAQGGAETAQGKAERSAEDSEAWAVGRRDNVDVGSTDPVYHNNSKYYAEQAAASAAALTVDDALSDSSEHPVQNKIVKVALDGKQAAENGKGLSKNDYTDAAKNVVDALADLLTAANNGKVLGIVNGALAAAELGSLIPDGDEVSY